MIKNNIHSAVGIDRRGFLFRAGGGFFGAALGAMWAADHSKKVRQIRKVRLEHGDIDVRVTRSGQHAIIELVSEQAKDWHYKNIPGAPAVLGDSPSRPVA